jgi:hypothetical protein
MSNQHDNDIEFDGDDMDAVDDHAVAPGGSATVNFARLGLNQVAYIRRAVVNDVPMWSIHAATGDTLGAAESFAQAWGAVKQNNLEPLMVH